MTETTLLLWLWTGHVLDFQVPIAICEDQIAEAVASADEYAIPTVSMPGLTASVLRMSCGGRSVILAIKPSDMPCEEAGS